MLRDVHEHRSGTRTYHHHQVGELELAYDVLEQPGQPGVSITTFSPEPGSVSAEKVAVLASWTADLQQGDSNRHV